MPDTSDWRSRQLKVENARLRRAAKELAGDNEKLMDRAMSAEALLRSIRTQSLKICQWITEAEKK